MTALPPTLQVPAAAELLGMSPDACYAAIRENTFPVSVLRIGRRIVVPTRPLLDVLGLVDQIDITAPGQAAA